MSTARATAHSRPDRVDDMLNDSSGPLAFLLNGTRIVVIAAIGFVLAVERNDLISLDAEERRQVGPRPREMISSLLVPPDVRGRPEAVMQRGGQRRVDLGHSGGIDPAAVRYTGGEPRPAMPKTSAVTISAGRPPYAGTADRRISDSRDVSHFGRFVTNSWAAIGSWSPVPDNARARTINEQASPMTRPALHGRSIRVPASEDSPTARHIACGEWATTRIIAGRFRWPPGSPFRRRDPTHPTGCVGGLHA